MLQKMKWMKACPWIYWLTCTTALASVVSSKNYDTKADDLTITGFQNIDDATYTVICETIFNPTLPITIILKKIIDGTNLYPPMESMGGSLAADSCSADFNDEIKLMGGKQSLFLLRGTNNLDNIVVEGATGEDTFPKFPTGPVYMQAGADDGTSLYVFRVATDTSHDFGDLDILEPGLSVTPITNARLRYYLLSTQPEICDYKLCHDFDTNVRICDKPTSVETISSLTKVDVASATLKYSSTSDDELVVTLPGSTRKIDIIFIDKQEICEGSDLTATCTGDFTTNKETNMLVIGLDTRELMNSYADHTFIDYNLVATANTANYIEVRWDSQSDRTSYYITLDKTDGDFQSATVTCSPPTAGLPCFGYFTGLTNGQTYVVTLQPKNGENPDETNKIEHEGITVGSSKLDQPQQLKIYWHHSIPKGSLLVCISHMCPNFDTAFSHYEFVLINSTGQWVKHYLMMDGAEADFCFDPFPLRTQDIEFSEKATLLVMQRGRDGFSVLASGETKVTFEGDL